MNPMMKRSLFLLLTASLLTPASALAAQPATSTSAVKAIATSEVAAQAANAKLSKDAAYQKALVFAKLSDGMKLDNTYFRSGDAWRSFPEWTFSWSKKKGEDDGSLYITVSVDANTGGLTTYSRSTDRDSVNTTKISREAAQKKADQFLKQANAQKAELVKLYERDQAAQKPPLGVTVFHNFHYVRYVDGIPFPDNGVDITVDGNGMITSYSLNWSDSVNFAKSGNLIDEKAALEAFKQGTKAKMAYLLPWENQNQDNQKPVLVYRNPFLNYLDAKSGKLVNSSLEEWKDTEPEAVSESKLPALHSGSQMTQDEAYAFAQKILPLSGYQLRNASYNESSYRGNRPVWNLQLEKKDKNADARQAYCEIDALSGDVLSFSNDVHHMLSEKADTVSKSKTASLKKAALDTLRKWSPTYASDLYYVNENSDDNAKNPGGSNSSYYQFQRFVNGVQAASGGASVTIDNETGEITSYYVNVGSESYPKALPNHISADQAADAWLKEAEPELVYISEPIAPEDQKKADGEVPRNAKLMYRMSVTPADASYVLDAANGGWIAESTGKPYTLHRETPTDIAGNPAEDALLLMYQYDAISIKDGKLMPELPISRGEMIDMLIITLNQGKISPLAYESRAASYADVAKSSKYFASVENAVDRGLLDKSAKNLNPDQKITRAELADMLVRALGYRTLASHNDMFTTKMTDIANNKLRGPIIIINSLGIMPAEQNLFQPDEEVSRADAALAFSRFLEKRAELVEKQNLNRY
ncbi:UNVERIFIED_CONTAM: hypothetical protein ABID98_000474 [Brevibacillus sp. OAP136]